MEDFQLTDYLSNFYTSFAVLCIFHTCLKPFSMIDYLISFSLKYSYLLIAALFVLKIVFFIRHRNKNWTIAQFFYFDPLKIKFTSNNERAKLKRLQNTLSIAIVLMILVQLAMIMMF